jgi:hypothetical protein
MNSSGLLTRSNPEQWPLECNLWALRTQNFLMSSATRSRRRVLRMNHKHEVAVLLADATAKLDHIPAALRSRGREPNTLSKSALGRSSMFRPHRETAFMSVATDHEPR